MKHQKRGIFALICLILLMSSVLTSCNGRTEIADGKEAYLHISQEEAKRIMDEEDCIILDVRTKEEYDDGHIPDAILIPVTEIESRAVSELPDKSSLILVYCRSGVRSKSAAEKLVELGYDNIKEFGGIMSWQYETVK